MSKKCTFKKKIERLINLLNCLFYKIQKYLQKIYCIKVFVLKINKQEMLKPKSQIFKLKFHLSKVEAVNNKVNSKVHAYLHIDNQQLQFKGAPELKKNIAIFGSDLEFDNFMINFDQITGLYEQKKVLLVIQFETQGAYIKIGQVSINVGQILNQKKYRVVNVYPLSKCYDKSAKAKLAVDFIPISQKRQNVPIGKKADVNFKQSSLTVQRKQQIATSNVNNVSSNAGNGFYKNPTGAIKSRLAEEQNVILQQRVYEYEKRMDNYRIAQNELSERMQQQFQRKDQKISQLSLELSKQQNTIHLITLQNQSFKTQIKSLNQQLQIRGLQIKQHLSSLQNLQKILQSKERQIQSKNISIENLTRTKQNKEKHLNLQIQKYTSKYSQSEQERNKIIFELENKLKLQLQKKDQHYQELIKSNQAKFLQSMKAVKQRNKYLETHAKQLEELSEEQDNKIKSLTLELQKSQALTQQQQEQMVYLNQQFSKQKKNRDLLSNELDSLNFSYQQSTTQLNQQKDLVKQLIKNIQLLKTQLSLSNQTVDQQRERMIIMSKDIQVHQERQYYMKQHYEEQLYDREVSQNNLRTQKQELIFQVKKFRQQLKLSEQKYEEEHQKNTLLKSNIQSLQKQLTFKNSSLMKFGEEKIYQETQIKNSKQLIIQLEQQLSKLEQEKAYLSQALMDKKIALQNDKSVEWTYKIESLQNDIQLMVQKFKNQKEQMKQQHRRQQVKKLDQMNKLSTSNKKLKQQIDQIREKLSKRQSYTLSIQKSLKNQKQKCLQFQRQLSSLKQTHRLVANQKQIIDQNLKESIKVRELKDKLIQQTQKKSQKYRKDINTIKNGFNRLISIVLQYMVKRYNQRTNFQDLSSNTVDMLLDTQIIGYVNVALKKFCDDHNKTRQMIKQLQEYKRSTIQSDRQSIPNNRSQKRINVSSSGQIDDSGQQNRFYQNGQDYQAKFKRNNYQYQQHIEQANYLYNKRNHTSRSGVHGLSPNRLTSSQSPFSNDPIKELQSYRHQLDRLKKEQSEWKVRFKSSEEQIQKHQRLHDNEKFQHNRLKTELQQIQDEMTRINFTLRKKDKIIKELEMEIQDLQKQNYQLKSTSTMVIQRAKQKLTSSVSQPIDNSASLPIIKDLQSKLSLKSQELVHVQRQLQSLRQQYLIELNQIKKNELKLKEKSTKINSLQKQLQAQSLRRHDDKDTQIIKLRKTIQKKLQQKQRIQDKVRELQNVIKQYELQVENLDSRNKQLQQQLKSAQVQMKRNIQSTQYKLNDKSTFYQTEILQYKSEIAQQRNKCQELVQKNSHLNISLAKKIKELQSVREKLSQKQKDTAMTQEQFQDNKNKMALKISQLNDKIREYETVMEGKSFELEQCRFAYEGRVLELQRQIDQFRDGLLTGIGNNSSR